MILTARVVQKPRGRYRCDWCSGFIDGPHMYLYGAAETYDKPSPMRLHLGAPCLFTGHPKIDNALNRHAADMPRSRGVSAPR